MGVLLELLEGLKRAVISDEEAARRLARSIVADMVAHDGTAALSDEGLVKEARALFEARVVPSRLGLLDDEIARRRHETAMPTLAGQEPRAPESLHPSLGATSTALVIGLVALLAALASLLFVLLRA